MATPRSTKLVLMGLFQPLRFPAEEIRVMRFAFHLLSYWLDDMNMASFDGEVRQKLAGIDRELKRLAIDQIAKSHRLNADTFAIAALMFALRGLHRKRRPRPGYFPYRWPKDTQQTALLRRLENARRRSVREWFRLGSVDCYRRWHKRWLRFMKLIQVGLRPVRLKQLEQSRQCSKEIVDQVLKNTKALLDERHPEQPYGEKDLRRIVRAALHHVRQDRALVGERDLVIPTKYGLEFLDEFVMKHLRRLFWKKVHEACSQEPSSLEEEEPDQGFATVLAYARLKATMQKVREAWT